MSQNRPTFIDYSSPDSEKSVYFDAPLMHIFSKRSDGGNGDAEEGGHVAPPPAGHNSIRSTTSLSGASPAQAPSALPDGPDAAVQPSDDEPGTSEGEDTGGVLTRDYGAGRVATNKPRSSGTASDSGYGSPTPRNKPLEDDMQPIPVVWAGDPGGTPRQSKVSAGEADVRRSQSMRSYRSSGTRRETEDGQSMHTAPTGRYTPAQRPRRVSMSGGAFAEGAGTVGPAAAADPEQTNLFRSRSVSAESALSNKQRLRITKEELKEGRRLAKVIQQEAKVEKRALEASVRELAELQKLQKYAVKEEAKANAAYGHALQKFHQEELAFLAAQARFERAKADLMAHEDAREAAREHAQQATEMLQEKSREVEWLRAQKAADDREREAKIRQLKGKV